MSVSKKNRKTKRTPKVLSPALARVLEAKQARDARSAYVKTAGRYNVDPASTLRKREAKRRGIKVTGDQS